MTAIADGCVVALQIALGVAPVDYQVPALDPARLVERTEKIAERSECPSG